MLYFTCFLLYKNGGLPRRLIMVSGERTLVLSSVLLLSLVAAEDGFEVASTDQPPTPWFHADTLEVPVIEPCIDGVVSDSELVTDICHGHVII